MKILIIFCDMLRANRLQIVNNNISKATLLDKWIGKFGGCTYTNCYTPAPDTPRGLACLYTGLYPKLNGCTLRTDWPRYYQKDQNGTIFQLLKECKYNIYTNFSKYELETGALTDKDLKCVSNYNSFLDLYNSDSIKDNNSNSLTFLTINDYHQCVVDYSALKIADKKGHSQLLNAFNMFFKKYNKDIFDYIFIFSDHGCILSDDNFSCQKKYNLLNDNRSKIFLHMRKKGEINSYVDSSLRSIMDIYPTIAEIANKSIPNNINGVSLFQPNPHDFIVIEDSCDFKPRLGIYNDIWRYKEIDYSYYLSIEDGSELKYENCNSDYNLKKNINTQKVLKRISNISFSYKDIKKRNDILKSYSEMHKQYSKVHFSSGNKRNNFLKNYFYKMYSIFSKFTKKFNFAFLEIFIKFK